MTDSCKLIPATLVLDGQAVASGEVSLEPDPILRGVFWPHGPITLDNFPDLRTTLKLSDRPDAIPLIGFQKCIATQLSQWGHYHFGFLAK